MATLAGSDRPETSNWGLCSPVVVYNHCDDCLPFDSSPVARRQASASPADRCRRVCADVIQHGSRPGCVQTLSNTEAAHHLSTSAFERDQELPAVVAAGHDAAGDCRTTTQAPRETPGPGGARAAPAGRSPSSGPSAAAFGLQTPACNAARGQCHNVAVGLVTDFIRNGRSLCGFEGDRNPLRSPLLEQASAGGARVRHH